MFTHDEGQTWGQSTLYEQNGQRLDGDRLPFKVMSDRVRPEVFYGFGDNAGGQGFYVSEDRGETFRQVEAPYGFPEVNLAGIDGRQIYEIRVEPGAEGVIWMAMLEDGLWRVTYDREKRRFDGLRVSADGDVVKRIGLGKPAQGNKLKTLFTSGTISGVYGFYRSDDRGFTWIRINDDQHQYGDIRSISGDPRVFGRIYVATGTRGIVYGDIVK